MNLSYNILYACLVFTIITALSCSGGAASTAGPEATCGRDRIASQANEKFKAANARWNGGDAWKALSEIKEIIDDEEETGGGVEKVDPELYFRRSDWGSRIGAKATARRDLEKIEKSGGRQMSLLAAARFHTFYNKFEDALSAVTERRALLCEGKGPGCVASCDLQKAYLLRRLGRKSEATAAFQQCQTEHANAGAACGKFGIALTEYFLGNYDQATQKLTGLSGDWAGAKEKEILELLIENKGNVSRGTVRGLGIRGFNTSRSLEELLVFPYYP